MKKLLVLLIAACSFAVAQAQLQVTTPPTVTTPTFSDDSYVPVPLQFGFPFYGKVFTNSWMHSNGVVSFFDPAVPISNTSSNPASWAYCCEGVQPSTTRPEFSYMIAPLWTDLYPVSTSSFRTEGTSLYQKYFWNNIAEISNTNNLNSFSLEIRPTGFIGINYSQVNIQNQNVWAGVIGDASLGEWKEIYFGRGVPTSGLRNWTIDGTQVDVCASNPLSSPSCPGYTEAMCSSNPLYSPTCPGYQQAYLTQQCSINALFDPTCPGYAAAYLTYQCSISALYSTACDGYEKAYHDDQCSKNALYAKDCVGYAEAYFKQQCELDGLYDTKCPNYATAYATRAVLEQQGTATIVAQAGTVASMAPVASTETTPTVTPSSTGNTTVDKAITPTTTTANSAAAPAAPVQLVQQPQPQQQAPAERKPEPMRQPAPGPSGDKPQQPTARQQMAERKAEAAKKEAAEKAKDMTNEMDKAQSLEQQKAVQNVLIAAMGYTPGFDAYSKVLVPDAAGYKPFTVYNNQRNVDNRRLGLGLYGPSDKLHDELVNSQYKGN